MEETMTLSRSIQAMKHCAASCGSCAHLYREGEVHRLLKRVDQLDRELPLQTMQAQIPYENTSGGFELFNTGITDLAPELIGWYGVPGVNPNGATTLYLIGKGFSVHSTQLIAGGKNLPFNLISWQVMQVEVPAGVQFLRRTQEGEGRLDEVVDIHLATPYGVSGHLLVPVARGGSGSSTSNGQIAWRQGAKVTLNASITESSTKIKSIAISNFFQATPNALLIDVPSVSPTANPNKLIFNISDSDNGTFVGTFVSNVSGFDPSTSSIVIAGSELNAIVGPQATTATALGFHASTPSRDVSDEVLNIIITKKQDIDAIKKEIGNLKAELKELLMRQTIGVSSSYRDVLRRDALDLSHRKQTEISISQDELAKLEYKFSRYLDSLPK